MYVCMYVCMYVFVRVNIKYTLRQNLYVCMYVHIRVNTSTMKAAAFDTTFSNALALKNVGGAYGGADFNPYTKSDTEIQV